MITSLFQKPIEFLSLNGSSSSFGYSPSEDAFYCLACLLFGHKFPEKASRVKRNQQPHPVKYMLKGKRKRKKVLIGYANHCIVKHGLFLVISWLI